MPITQACIAQMMTMYWRMTVRTLQPYQAAGSGRQPPIRTNDELTILAARRILDAEVNG